ncbi:MAG: cytoplasmic protein [Syntrophorhabdus sp.]
MLTADANLIFEIGPINTLPCAATTIYKGSAIGASSGYATTLVAGQSFRGFADAKVDNSGGSPGDKNVDVITEGYMQVAISGVAITDVGKPVYMSDDSTFTLTEGSNSLVGFVYRYVSSGYAVIKFGVKPELSIDLPASTAPTASTTTTGGCYGFSTSAQAASVLAAVRALVNWAKGD